MHGLRGPDTAQGGRGSREARAPWSGIRFARRESPSINFGEGSGVVSAVVIGIDPHKASHTAVAVDEHEVALGGVRVRDSAGQAERLLEWAALLAGADTSHELRAERRRA